MAYNRTTDSNTPETTISELDYAIDTSSVVDSDSQSDNQDERQD